MMLQNLKNLELHQCLNSLAEKERKLTHQVLLHIIEADRRKLFLHLAYPSLYEYLVKGIGYSAAAAQRRIDAARLMKEIPEIGAQVEKGTLHLSQLGQLRKVMRFIKKNSPSASPLDFVKKTKLIEKLQNKSFKETELFLAQTFSLPEIHDERKSIQKDESIRVEITFSKEEMEIIEKAQSLLSHSLGKQGLSFKSLKDLLLYQSKRVIQQKTEIRPMKSGNRPSADSIRKHGRITKTFSDFKVIPASIKKQTLRQQTGCQFKDHLTGKICNSKDFLEFDHIKPRWDGGDNGRENIRLLCSNHNKYRYQIGK